MSQSLVSWLASLPRKAQDYYNSLSSQSKVALWVYAAIQVIITAGVLYKGPAAIFEMLAGWAQGLRDMYMGWLVLVGLTVLTSFPPLIGYGTCQTLAGFAFGTRDGWLIAVTGCMLGSLLSFVFVRRLITLFAPMLARNTTFKALSHAVRAKGLPLVILIRLCPFPFPYSNAFFASIESVTLPQFLIATLCTTPKLLLHVWTGARMYLFADPDSRQSMDEHAKYVNAVYVGVGSVLGFGTSYYIYKLTMRYVEEANAEGALDLEAGGLMDDVDELLGEDDSDREEPRAPAPAASKTKHDSVAAMPTDRRASVAASDWGGSISDFGGTPRQSMEGRHSVDEDDGWGLSMDPVEEERPSLEELRSVSQTSIAIDKRRD